MKVRSLTTVPRGRRGAVVVTAVTAVTTLLTAGSQAPGPGEAAPVARNDGTPVPGGFVAPDVPLPDVPSQGDDSYHIELPPLRAVQDARNVFGDRGAGVSRARAASEAGLPAGVFTAYRRAASSVGRTDPGCGLRWELLAAIGKVESGHARGGAVAPNGDTLSRITGPALDGNGFALIHDSEGGAWDGDAVYDRAVGPMQFLPTTWKTWGTDGNGDGVANPNNVHDAALAAAHYLCAGDRDLRTGVGLDRAILSYNHSREYLNLVLGWMEFYLRGVHTVPDGTGVVPGSPGAGGDTPATRPVGPGGAPRGGVAGGHVAGDGVADGGTGGTGGTGGAVKPEPAPGPSTTSAPGSGTGAGSGPTGGPSSSPSPLPSPSQSASPTPTESTPADGPTTGAPVPGSPAPTSPTSPEPTGATPSGGASASPSAGEEGEGEAA
ncbi:lytic murein transglycosylase [Streptomyces sp. enrichment culture]|uniref:lytic transglycosylase domain-containing protein n=1 Tax=Streptomyces sp. enrichment culture TaxID=1795815 RepID=UPI003F56D723